MAYTDPPHRAPNRAMLFQEMAAPSVERAPPGARPRRVQGVNDVAGHEAGDQPGRGGPPAAHRRPRGRPGRPPRRPSSPSPPAPWSRPRTSPSASSTSSECRTAPASGPSPSAPAGVAELGAAGGSSPSARPTRRSARQAGRQGLRPPWRTTRSPTWSSRTPTSPPSSTRACCSSRFDAACDADGSRSSTPSRCGSTPSTDRPRLELWTAAERGRSAALQRKLPREACREVASLADDGVTVAVSLPAGHVSPDGLAAEVADALAEAGLAPSCLALSFTEETLLTSSAAFVPELEAARLTGVRLRLDNYAWAQHLRAAGPDPARHRPRRHQRARPARRHRPARRAWA